MKIYFELGPLHHLSEFLNITPPIIITSVNGYATMIADAANAIKNKWDIYTNDISLLGAGEVFGDRFLHHIMIRDNNKVWVEFNPHILRKLAKPIEIEQYFRRNICNKQVDIIGKHL